MNCCAVRHGKSFPNAKCTLKRSQQLMACLHQGLHAHQDDRPCMRGQKQVSELMTHVRRVGRDIGLLQPVLPVWVVGGASVGCALVSSGPAARSLVLIRRMRIQRGEFFSSPTRQGEQKWKQLKARTSKLCKHSLHVRSLHPCSLHPNHMGHVYHVYLPMVQERHLAASRSSPKQKARPDSPSKESCSCSSCFGIRLCQVHM